MTINERYYIINMRGTKQLTGNNVRYEVLGFSTQDMGSCHSMYWKPLYGTQTGKVELAYTRDKDSLDSLYPVLENLQLTPEITQDGKKSGTSYLDNKVITEWVWQTHSNPTKITSANQYACTTDGSTFQVTATGKAPIKHSLSSTSVTAGVPQQIKGEVFAGLKQKSGAKMVLSQQGATITFSSGDIGNVNNAELFDFAFSKTAPNAGAMLQGAGGGNSFTYSFAHNGSLPGFAEFSIDTGMTEGTVVNVYKYEAEAGKFSLIASNVKVGAGGKVSYKNNTTSEYIITTQNIAGAVVSEAYSHQGNNQGFLSQGSLLLVIGGVLILLLAIGEVLVFIKRKQAGKSCENIK